MRPACPKCGEPARVVVVVKARARCVLKDDGQPGPVLSLSKEPGTVVAYECGGPCGPWEVSSG